MVLASLLIGGCSPSREKEGSCLADSAGTLRVLESVPHCAGNAYLECRLNCLAGNAASCLGLAYDAETDAKRRAEAIRYYRRACSLGAANGCTNYAASIWAGTHTAAELVCARRIFEKSCAAKEPFACGMVGRLMLESENPASRAGARKYLESACDRVGGFPCRVLARHLETGKLGAYKPEQIRALLTKACNGGDPDACGEHATAAETFH